MKKSPYQVLGVAASSTSKQIKARFYELSKKHHPDRHRGETEELQKQNNKKFHEIREAYDILGDPEKRSNYDSEATSHGRHHSHHHQHTASSNTSSQNDFYGAHRNARDYYSKPPNFYSPPSGMRRSASGRGRVYNYGRAYNPGSKGDPLNYGYRQPSDHDVPHFDFDKHYEQQKGYDEHRRKKNEEEQEAMRKMDMERRGKFWNSTTVGLTIIGLAGIIGWLK